MRPMRSGGGSRFFLPTRTWSTPLAGAIVVMSILCGLLGAWGVHLELTQEVIKRGFVWQLISYAFIDVQPMGVLFAALALWQMGSSLEMSWGPKRFLLFALVTPALAGAITCLVMTPLAPQFAYPGAWVLGEAAWCAYGWSWGKRQTNFWGLPLSGNGLAGIGILFVVLEGALGSFWMTIPSFIGIGLTFLYVRYGSPMMWITRMRSASLQRKLKGRGNHLRVVGKDRNIGGGSDQYLH